MIKKIIIVLAVVLLGVGFFERTKIEQLIYGEKIVENEQPISNQTPVDPSVPEMVVSPTTENTFTIVIKDKKLVEGDETIKVTEGSTVKLDITSDFADELHLHGYDLSINLDKDEMASLTFIADKTGRFVYELEDSAIEIGAIEVQPK